MQLNKPELINEIEIENGKFRKSNLVKLIELNQTDVSLMK